MTSTDLLKVSLLFPFRDPNWMRKLLIAFLLCAGGLFIPVIPSLFFMGYVVEIMIRIIVEKKEPSLPEWTNWGDFMRKGLKYLGINFFYLLPGSVVMSIAFIFLFGYSIALPLLAERGSSDPVLLTIGMFVFMGIFMLVYFLSFFLMGMGYLMTPPAICRVVETGRFWAGFDIPAWWRVVRKNLTGFVLVTLVLLGMLTLLYTIFYFSYFLVLFCCFLFLLWMALGVYVLLVSAAAYAGAYRQGLDALEEASRAG